MKLNINRLASAAVAIWCMARIYERQGWEAAIVALFALTGLLSIIWFAQTWIDLMRKSYAARHALDRDRPQSGTAVGIIGWVLLLLFAVALYFNGRPV